MNLFIIIPLYIIAAGVYVIVGGIFASYFGNFLYTNYNLNKSKRENIVALMSIFWFITIPLWCIVFVIAVLLIALLNPEK